MNINNDDVNEELQRLYALAYTDRDQWRARCEVAEREVEVLKAEIEDWKLFTGFSAPSWDAPAPAMLSMTDAIDVLDGLTIGTIVIPGVGVSTAATPYTLDYGANIIATPRVEHERQYDGSWDEGEEE